MPRSKPCPPVRSLKQSLKKLEEQASDLIIRRLRFPFYRSLARDAELPFEFPVTALIGRNGANKSAVLHAIYGCPFGQSLGDFWFETSLDGIPAVDPKTKRKQSVVHVYQDSSGQDVQCLKTRASRPGSTGQSGGVANTPQGADPDYWEPEKRSRTYGFPPSSGRTPPVQANVVHIDFRALLPAFDMYFHFPDEKHLFRLSQQPRALKLRRTYRKQDYLRNRARNVSNRISNDASSSELSLEVVRAVSYILEREYSGGRIVEHAIYHGHRGRTVTFQVPDGRAGSYSDAAAGSGESAATFLVHDLLAAQERSLVLLDEPETSLFPRAQQRLMEFVCDVAARRRHQVVLATHSEHIAERLPPRAIRLLQRGDDGRVRILLSQSAEEALGDVVDLPAAGKRVVVVEDDRTATVVREAMRLLDKQLQHRILVRTWSGGVKRIYSDMRAYTREDNDRLTFLLDGDEDPGVAIPTVGGLPQGEKELRELANTLTRGQDERGPDLGFVDAAEVTRFIELLRNRVRYLPALTPEHLVWDEAVVSRRFLDKTTAAAIGRERDPKKRLKAVADKVPGLTAEAVFSMLLSNFLNTNSPNREDLLNVVAELTGYSRD